jgi:predicted esterase
MAPMRSGRRRADRSFPFRGERVWVIPPAGEHTHTLIYCHGFGENNSGGWYEENCSDIFCHRSSAAFPGLRILCPDAPMRDITVYEGERLRSWYDYLTDHEGEAEDELRPETMEDAAKRIHALVARETKTLGDASRVFVGGCSQGCITSLHAVATLPAKATIGAFVGCVGHVLKSTPVENLPSRVQGGLYFFQGISDKVMQWQWVGPTFERLQALPMPIHIRRVPGIGHDIDDVEHEMLASFLTSVMPTPSLEAQLDAIDEADGEARRESEASTAAPPSKSPSPGGTSMLSDYSPPNA